MKKFKVLSCTESSSSTADNPLFRCKAAMRDSSWPSFAKSKLVYFSGQEAVDVGLEFEMNPKNIQTYEFDYALPEDSDSPGELIKLTGINFI